MTSGPDHLLHIPSQQIYASLHPRQNLPLCQEKSLLLMLNVRLRLTSDRRRSQRTCQGHEEGHLSPGDAVGVHEGGQVDAEDGDATQGAAMQANQFCLLPEVVSDEGAVQAGGHLVDVLCYQDALAIQQHQLQPQGGPSFNRCWLRHYAIPSSPFSVSAIQEAPSLDGGI